MKEEPKIIHDKECIHCKRLFECKGKAKGTNCVMYEERGKDGRQENVHKESY